MARTDLTLGDLTARDHAFYGLVWAGATLSGRVDQALTKAHDLPLSWFEVMLWLHGQDEPVAASDLGAKTLLSRSQVSRVADSLQARGLVERAPSPTDARSVRIALTTEGHRLFAEADATRRATLAEAFDDRLDDADIAALETVWAKLKRPPTGRGA
ncbi:MarR family transcriptional regulator [Kitasatospora sp. NBC_00085]|uniref:MarR family winged helix-turn-helix transcriptional regulator n=1 Tax=unclassified Kitasatospora TaxID=2633591 RepID=UPI0032440689